MEIFNRLLIDFPECVYNKYPFPDPYDGKGKIKAIILGADPTRIVNGVPVHFENVFDLDYADSWENSPYWRSIRKNLELIPNLGRENLYIQNVCRNYFKDETSKNKGWSKITRDHWIPFLKKELDEKFDVKVPILMTTEFILHASLNDEKRKIKADDIYKNHFTISGEENLFSRELIAFYRHWSYSLNLVQWEGYKEFIINRIGN